MSRRALLALASSLSCVVLRGALAAVVPAVRVTLEHALSPPAAAGGSGAAPWAPRATLTGSLAADGASYGGWRNATPAGAGVLDGAALRALVELVKRDGLYRVRAAAEPADGDAPGAGGGARPPWVYGATKACALVAAGLEHNVRFLIDPATARARAVDVSLGGAWGGACAGVAGVPPARWAALLAAADAGAPAPLPARFGAVVVEESPPVPALPPGAKGAPHPGQRELTPEALAAVAAAAGAGGAGAEGAAGAPPPPPPPRTWQSWIQTNWLTLAMVGAYMAVSFMREPPPAQGARGGGGGAGGGPRRARAE